MAEVVLGYVHGKALDDAPPTTNPMSGEERRISIQCRGPASQVVCRSHLQAPRMQCRSLLSAHAHGCSLEEAVASLISVSSHHPPAADGASRTRDICTRAAFFGDEATCGRLGDDGPARWDGHMQTTSERRKLRSVDLSVSRRYPFSSLSFCQILCNFMHQTVTREFGRLERDEFTSKWAWWRIINLRGLFRRRRREAR